MSAQKLDDKEVEQLLRAGWTQVEIVQLYRDKGVDVTQSAISQAISTGRIKADTGRSTGGVPWKLNPEHRHHNAARMLRTQARLDRGLTIGKTLVPQVERWKAGLAADGDSVVHYDPDTDEGFWRVPRRPGVDLWWVREPTLDDNGMTVRNRPNIRRTLTVQQPPIPMEGTAGAFGARGHKSDDPATKPVERRPSRRGVNRTRQQTRTTMSDNSAAITDRAITKLVEGFDVYLRDIVTEFAVNAGVSAARVEAIGRDEQPTNREFEDLGFGYIDLLTFVAKEV